MSNDNLIEIKLAKAMPSYLIWAGYGLIFGLALVNNLNPAVWVTYALAGIGFTLMYLFSSTYNTFVGFHNHTKMKELTGHGTIEELLEKLGGTFDDEDGLIPREQEKNDEQK